MTDERRLGHAQRRRLGAPSNMYDSVMDAPTYSEGDEVKAQGRYGVGRVIGIMPNIDRPSAEHDGHGYVVQGGKLGRVTVHLSGELKPFEMGMKEAL